MSSSLPIGVFDSGLGGLTVLSEMAKALPQERFVYLGDTARVPYGNRSAHIIQRYSFEDIEFLLKQKVKMIVIACNTATAHAEEVIRQRYNDIPVVGVIQPGVDALLKKTQSKCVGIAATYSTIQSGEYRRRILEKKKDIQVFSSACPLLVPLIEEGWIDKEVTRLVIQEYFSGLVREKADAVVLGCTHYPLIKAAIQAEFPNLDLIDSSQETAKAVREVLEKKELTSSCEPAAAGPRICLYFTDMSDQANCLEKFLSDISFDHIQEIRL